MEHSMQKLTSCSRYANECLAKCEVLPFLSRLYHIQLNDEESYLSLEFDEGSQLFLELFLVKSCQ